MGAGFRGEIGESGEVGRRAADELRQQGRLDSLSERVLGAAFEVSNTLGAGFVEKVYQRALAAQLRLRGIRPTMEASFTVTSKGQAVGTYVTDLLVVELKCVDRLGSEHLIRQVVRIGGRIRGLRWFRFWPPMNAD